MNRVFIHASEILTGQGFRSKKGRKPQEADLGSVRDGALVYSSVWKNGKEIPEKILWVGKTLDLPEMYQLDPFIDLEGKSAIIPGLVDCHTHLVFAGDRAGEFAERCGGASYQEIAKKGGGIQTTVEATRKASEEELFRLGCARMKESYGFGVRTIEIKSGYGLSSEAEFKILRVIKRLQDQFPEMRVVSTFLGAHDIPKDRTREKYIQEILEEMLPRVAGDRLASACDVFIDDGFYSREEGLEILEKAITLGLKVKIHADELGNTESASLAAKLGAISADHLLKISDAGIRDLAESETTAVLLPGTAFYLKTEQAPARKLLDAGVRVAFSTDFNPGTSVSLNLPAILTIAALYLKMTRAEIFAAVTYNAACALGLQDEVGVLETGKTAHFIVLPYEKPEELYYRFAAAPITPY